ncbi:MAG: hypothetical protein ABJN69_13045 [Hellea sp.]
MFKIKVSDWDLGLHDAVRDVRDFNLGEFPIPLNLWVNISEGDKSSDDRFNNWGYTIQLSTPEILQNSGIRIIEKTIFFYDEFCPRDFVEGMINFIQKLDFTSEKEAVGFMDQIFSPYEEEDISPTRDFFYENVFGTDIQ